MDFKQTNKPKRREWIGDYFLQCTAYALAHNEMYGTDIKDVAIFMCSREGLWQLFEMQIGEFAEWELKWAKRLEEFYNIS
jgi:genome maintenance exonuclease 1